MILSEVVVPKVFKVTNVEAEQTAVTNSELLDSFNQIAHYLSHQFGNADAEKSAAKAVEAFTLENIKKQLSLSKEAVIKDGAAIPIKTFDWLKAPKYEKEVAAINTFNKLPKTTLSSLKSIATKLGMIILPTKYLLQEALNAGPKKEIEAFQRVCSSLDLSSYVVTPLSFYDTLAHAKDKEESSIFAGAHLQTFNTITLTLPMFRAIFNDIEILNSKYDVLKDGQEIIKQRVQTAETNIKVLQENLKALEMQFAEQVRQTKLRELEAQKQHQATLERLREVENTRRFVMEDPMLIALPSKHSINDGTESWAAIGPCWGPDFDDILAETLGFVPNKEQREQFTTAISSALTNV